MLWTCDVEGPPPPLAPSRQQPLCQHINSDWGLPSLMWVFFTKFFFFLFLNEMCPNFTHFTTEEDVGSWNKIPNTDIEILNSFPLLSTVLRMQQPSLPRRATDPSHWFRGSAPDFGFLGSNKLARILSKHPSRRFQGFQRCQEALPAPAVPSWNRTSRSRCLSHHPPSMTSIPKIFRRRCQEASPHAITNASCLPTSNCPLATGNFDHPNIVSQSKDERNSVFPK